MKKILFYSLLVVFGIGNNAMAACSSCNSCKKAKCNTCSSCGCNKKYKIVFRQEHSVEDDKRVAEYMNYPVMEPVPVVQPAVVEEVVEEPVRKPKKVYSKGNWYVGGRGEVSFLSWKNKYSTDYSNTEIEFDSDKYTFEPMLGVNAFVGYYFDRHWRSDLELGYLGNFEDEDNGFTFDLSATYLTANVYYDFSNDFYLGAGLGAALPKTTLDWEFYTSGARNKTNVSLMGALMAGYAYRLSNDWLLDIRYRLSVFNGTKHKRDFTLYPNPDHTLTNKIGLIWDNSISVGVRYEF